MEEQKEEPAAPLNFFEKMHLFKKIRKLWITDKTEIRYLQYFKNQLHEIILLIDYDKEVDFSNHNLSSIINIISGIVFPVRPEDEIYVHRLNQILDKLLANSREPNLFRLQLYIKLVAFITKGDFHYERYDNAGNLNSQIDHDVNLSCIMFEKLIEQVNKHFRGDNTFIEIHAFTCYDLIFKQNQPPEVLNYFDEMLDVLLQDSPQGSYVLK
jgi:hypothetical protein